LLFQPSDNLSFRLIGDYSKRDEECCAATYLPASDHTAAGEEASSFAAVMRGLGGIINDDTYDRDVSITPGRSYRSDVKDYGLSGELVYDLGGAELTSITAYRYNQYTRGQDADFNNLDILYRDDDGTAYNRFKTFSQELRVQGETFGGKLDWLIGGYYANEKLRVRDNLAYGSDYLRFINCRLAIAQLPTALAPTAPSCINSAVLTGNQNAVNAGIAQLTAGINALSAIPPASRTPAQQAQLNALIAQRAGLLPTQGLLNALNANPANPGFGSVANALGIPGNDPFAGVGLDDVFNQTSNNLAVFTHNIFEITDGLKLTVGARYTRERKQLKATLTDNNVYCRTLGASPLAALQQLPCVIPSVPGGSYSDSSKKTESKLSGTVVLSYKPTPELLTYASFSRGYKGGGYNLDRSAMTRTGGTGPVSPTATLDSLKFNPEINNAIEVGGKYNGRGFDVNLAVFQQSFDDFQLNLFNGIAFEVDTVNSCSDDLGGTDTDNSSLTGACTGKLKSGVRSRGVELEFFTRPMRDVTLNVGGIYANTRYRKNLVGAGGDPTSAELFQLPGRRLSNSSAFTITASSSWTPRIGTSGLSGLLYVDARHSSEFNTGSDLDREKIQKPYTVVNGRIGIRGPDQAWAVELWAQNILNKNYKQVAFDAPLQGTGTVRGVEQGFYTRSTQLFGAFLAEPRTYGLTLRARISPAKAAPEAFVAPPAPVAPATQTCADGSVIAVDATCPVIAPPEAPLPVPAPERG
jgi:outer membrane receptor protein involved in Fe transport